MSRDKDYYKNKQKENNYFHLSINYTLSVKSRPIYGKISDTIKAMARFNIVFAILLSLTLIGGASWFRFAKAIEYSPDLVTLEPGNQNDLLENTLVEELSSASPPKTSSEPFSETDLVSRQLFSDYVQLTSQGRATPNNLSSLASKYTESILNSKIEPDIDRSQIIVVSDSSANLKFYNQQVFALRSRYAGLMSSASRPTAINDIDDPEFKRVMTYAGKLYQEAANELMQLPVPSSLSENHLKLIENYLSSSEALETLTHASEDPVRTYAALNLHAQNTEAEDSLLSNIQIRVLSSEGMFNGGI
ncbi:MAG: hypothetical protein AAB641_01390 [Patescibacteria group bacterium]